MGGSRGPCHIRRIIGKRISGEIREEGLVYIFYALPFFPICVELAEGREIQNEIEVAERARSKRG